MKDFPIPQEALDDRLAILGTAGSGKTYAALGAMARLMGSGARLIGIDPQGVMWGLRLAANGKTSSGLDPVIFGGPHGDVSIHEHAGGVIGEAVAGMRESCIIDLSELGTKAAERRFMLAFLTALYRHTTGDPVHLLVDEADMWAPQRLMDKEGEAAKLLGMMETIVRRGRVRGFIPWLITQRPAVLSKDVLSQVDGVVALKLTAKQDRDAIAGWIEGAADREEGRSMLAGLPAKQQGQGVFWNPARGILTDAVFPKNATYDSSRTPKRGEFRPRAELPALDLGALRERLVAVEDEAKANDPAALRQKIAKLKAAAEASIASSEAICTARAEAFAEGAAAGRAVARAPDRPLTSDELQAACLAKLQPAQRRILEAVISYYPRALPRERLAALAGANASSSAFTNNVSRLHMLKFLTYPAQGQVAAAATLFLS